MLRIHTHVPIQLFRLFSLFHTKQQLFTYILICTYRKSFFSFFVIHLFCVLRWPLTHRWENVCVPRMATLNFFFGASFLLHLVLCFCFPVYTRKSHCTPIQDIQLQTFFQFLLFCFSFTSLRSTMNGNGLMWCAVVVNRIQHTSKKRFSFVVLQLTLFVVSCILVYAKNISIKRINVDCTHFDCVDAALG